MAIVDSTRSRYHHPSHPGHELKLTKFQKPYKCDGCKELGFGSRYRCQTCDFDLHEDCMFTAPITYHEFFHGDTFRFLQRPPDACNRYCDACGKEINGFVYHCEKRGWDLHPCCRNLKAEMCIDGVEFRLRDKVSSKCIWCNKKILQGSCRGISGWSYVSKCKKYHFHVYCATEEMVAECWKSSGGEECIAAAGAGSLVVVPNKKIVEKWRGSGGRHNKYWRLMKIFLKAIASILLGDPTTILASLVVDVISS